MQSVLKGCQDAVHSLHSFLDADLTAVAKLGSLLQASGNNPGPTAQQALPPFMQPFSRPELQVCGPGTPACLGLRFRVKAVLRLWIRLMVWM